MAVRSVAMRSLNRQRANVVLAHLLEADKVLSPLDVAQRYERVFELRDGVLRGARREVLGWGRLGVALGEVIAVLPSASSSGAGIAGSGARVLGRSGGGEKQARHAAAAAAAPSLARLLRIFEQEAYVLWFDAKTRTALIVLKQDAGPVAQVQAWAQALMMAGRYAGRHQQQQKQQQHGKREGPAGGQKGASQEILSSGGRGGASADGEDGAADEFAACEAELQLTLERARDMFDESEGEGRGVDVGGGVGGGALPRRRGLARQRLEAAGWDLSIAALETRSGSRLQAVGKNAGRGGGGGNKRE
ncbi:uncharacterized protein J3D65DRAFT_105909 [Phyllosticta citribraziliensis]|uniref:Uncharacterized protein n=1 Tax=Phyllosticta citribraziliensis TaxID=989973 RepID=A0ABR1LB28_9PEZI